MAAQIVLLGVSPRDAEKAAIPDPATVKQCPDRGKSIGGKGYYGPECMCNQPQRERIIRPGDNWG